MEILKTAEALLKEHALCDYCLGRQFALLAHGLTNQERGKVMKLLLTLEGDRLALEGSEEGTNLLITVARKGFSNLALKTLENKGITVKTEERCHLCENNFNKIKELMEKTVEKLAEYEYKTFLVGITVPPGIENREDELRAKFNIKWGENIRNELSREIGRQIVSITQKTVDYKKPDVLIIINPFTDNISLNVRPLFIAGRYRKLVRGIPQSKWICKKCEGVGCTHCKGTGKIYPESVEELIAAPLLEMTEGTDTRFHAAGREDIDARVLGSGRPFIIEVKKPKTRNIKLRIFRKKMTQTAEGKVEVSKLRIVSKEKLKKIKTEEKVDKVYRVVVEFEKKISDEDLKQLKEGLTDSLIRQLTPSRVLHRRVDKMRKRRIFKVKVKRLKPRLVEMLIRCQGGLYIKELISGDQGRTDPNVSSLVDTSAKCVEIDVMGVKI